MSRPCPMSGGRNGSADPSSKGPYPYQEGEHLVVAATEWVHTDESGVQGESARWCLVAGFRASPGQWGKFDKAWRRVLRDHRVDGAFHSHDFFNREDWNGRSRNQFLDWKPARARALLSAI